MFDLLLAAPLVVRRRWPAAVFLIISGIALVQWAADVQAHADVAVLIGLYTIGAYELRRWLILLAATLAEVGVVLATLRWAPAGQELTAALLLTGTVTAAWVVGVYVRTRRAYLSAVLERAETAERERDQQSQLAVAAERARIARELHDVIAHSLSVMIALNDGAAATALAAPHDTRLAAQQASAVGRQSLAEMRRLLGVLRTGEAPALLPQPDHAQIEDVIDQVRTAGLPVELAVSGRPQDSPGGVQLTVYRIVQESLTNVFKHAPAATRIRVRLDYTPDGVDIEVTNDDPSPHRTPAAAGHGLLGMQERASVYGGNIVTGRGDDGSWRVSTRLSLDNQGDQQ